MIFLPLNCRCSTPTIIPKNWKQLTQKDFDPKKIWRVHYRFYDPSRPGSKQVNIKTGINEEKSLKARKQAAAEMLCIVTASLKTGYNPYYKKIMRPAVAPGLDPGTPLMEALTQALGRLQIEEKTKKEMASILKVLSRAATYLGYTFLPVREVKRSTMKAILEQCYTTGKKFSNNTYNHYRKYLRILFSELVECDTIEYNPITDLKKKPVVTVPRNTLSNQQRRFVNDLLQKRYPSFHRFTHIFFHSGARISELMRIRVKDVDLEGQRYRMEIKKGRTTRVLYRTIKNMALPLWMNLVEGGTPEDFIFSTGLRPGPRQLRPDQITKRWYRLIKKGKHPDGRSYGITADFYSLKHSHTTDVVDRMGAETAAEINGHTTTAMVLKIYDTRAQERRHALAKTVDIPFASGG
jgi:integrase